MKLANLSLNLKAKASDVQVRYHTKDIKERLTDELHRFYEKHSQSYRKAF